jgi:2-C-methyl-D-erythritol 2,4-cyclodiphosphate synthase
MKIRVGQGYDVHRLEEGRDFWLGGIKVLTHTEQSDTQMQTLLVM